MPIEEYDSADLDAILELERSRGYELLTARIESELERNRLALELPASGPFERGQVKAIRMVLTIAETLKAEIKAQLK